MWFRMIIRQETLISSTKSADGGSMFTEPIKNLSSNTGISFQSKIATSGGNVHVVWQDETSGNGDILYRRSTDDGRPFPNIIKNLSSNAAQSINPAVAVSGNNLHVIWADRTPGNFDIFTEDLQTVARHFLT